MRNARRVSRTRSRFAPFDELVTAELQQTNFEQQDDQTRRPNRYLAIRSLALIFCSLPLLGGCPHESAFPLPPTNQERIDPRLLADWRCVSSDSEKLALISVMPFDEKQYYVSAAEDSQKAVSMRATISLLKAVPLLSIRILTNLPADEPPRWYFARYSFVTEDVLHIELVKKDSLTGVSTTAAALRLLESRIQDPGLYETYCVCARVR